MTTIIATEDKLKTTPETATPFTTSPTSASENYDRSYNTNNYTKSDYLKTTSRTFTQHIEVEWRNVVFLSVRRGVDLSEPVRQRAGGLAQC